MKVKVTRTGTGHTAATWQGAAQLVSQGHSLAEAQAILKARFLSQRPLPWPLQTLGRKGVNEAHGPRRQSAGPKQPSRPDTGSQADSSSGRPWGSSTPARRAACGEAAPRGHQEPQNRGWCSLEGQSQAAHFYQSPQGPLARLSRPQKQKGQRAETDRHRPGRTPEQRPSRVAQSLAPATAP